MILLNLLMPFWTPTYALVAKIAEQINIVVKSNVILLFIFKVSEITDEIKGKDRPSPTPAPQIIAPINKTSNKNFIILFSKNNIPENVSFDLGFRLKARPNATTGKQ